MIMRLGQGMRVLFEVHLHAMDGTPLATSILRWVELLTSSLLTVGLWTPVSGVLQSLLELRSVYADGRFDLAFFDGALLALCLCLLGPGAWSIDARLYGRRRIVVNPPLDK